MKIETSSSVELSSLLALCLVSLLFFKLVSMKKTRNTAAAALPPGPTAYPIIGSLPQMLMNKPSFQWIHNFMQELNTEIACIRLGRVHVIAVTSPELSREFLKKQDAVFASRPDAVSARLVSDGYLTLALTPAGDQWKKMRKVLVSEVLSTGVFRRLHARRCEEADHLVRYVLNQCQNQHQNGRIDVRDVSRHYCGNVIRKMVFGERFFGGGERDGGPGVEEREHIDGLFTILKFLYGFSIADFVPWLEIFDFDGHKKIVADAVKNVRKYQDPKIDKRMEMWQRGIKKEEEDGDILDVLINLKNLENEPLLSVREIKALILEIMIETVDNPSNAVEWAMAEMINEPKILDKACEELDRVVGKDRLVEESDLPKLNYVKACLRESFRLHPLAPFNVPHVSSEDTVVGGYFIPKASYVVLSRPGLGRNPRIWDDPLKFNPERHIIDETSEVVLTDPELRMLTFSTGRRGCPGIVLGSTLSTMLLARLIQGFSWRPPLDTNCIDLAESEHDLAMAKPLIAHAMPRLDSPIYLQLIGN
ncbi:phenylalanine N-monooxygenase-like protein [Perilla frutescens var. hirtella]|uniref:Phenylalanine N-monooxygenase-like protein n=1 Tax=Perilla frutescens var. hirtella TaxID=608512 RepID=A0AAD4JQ75_PERFH|nr:phenylalanine N-monooxygenase-like protein [Perilla frutescens var. hirtella]